MRIWDLEKGDRVTSIFNPERGPGTVAAVTIKSPLTNFPSISYLVRWDNFPAARLHYTRDQLRKQSALELLAEAAE